MREVSHHGRDKTGQPILKLPDHLLAFARQLRRVGTAPERVLWECLRNRQLCGLKFRRQHAFGSYIADFYCHEARLIVEVDGAIHALPAQAEHDEVRRRELLADDVTIIRISNDDLMRDLPGTLHKIAQFAQRYP